MLDGIIKKPCEILLLMQLNLKTFFLLGAIEVFLLTVVLAGFLKWQNLQSIVDYSSGEIK